MQSSVAMKSANGLRAVPVVRRHLRIVSDNLKSPSAPDSRQTQGTRHVYKTEDGMIIVKAEEGVFYIRHNIIFAKAGDVFYMPRKIPADFDIKAERVITDAELSNIESMCDL